MRAEKKHIREPKDLTDILGGDIKRDDTAGVCYVIDQSLDFSGITDFKPLGAGTNYSFDGTLDGRGNTIKNLTVHGEQAYKIAMLIEIGLQGIVKNLCVENIHVEQYFNTGAISRKLFLRAEMQRDSPQRGIGIHKDACRREEI
ncbi:MAG: hypothetical protein LBH63_03525 [Clostridiales Family XIII bacterium]|jgi:hypothetical protein|nr:hypothetical protein [Clostridiales Family XIII bacterium]